MRNNRHLVSLLALAAMVGAMAIIPQHGSILPIAYAGDAPNESKIIADTIAAHQILCLSKNGLIETVLLDGQWVSVQEVKLVNRTLILRTEVYNISLAAAFNAP